MSQIDLKKKILSGYLFICGLVVLVGALSFGQFGSLGGLVGHLTTDVASEVYIVNEIRSEILAMRTAVEKFIYKNKRTDKESAEKHINNVINLLEQAKKEINPDESKKQLVQIESNSNDYIDNFNKVAIRIDALAGQKNNLFLVGNEISNKLYKFVLQYKDEPKTFHVVMDALIQFSSAANEVKIFLDQLQVADQKKASTILNAVLSRLGSLNNKSMQEVIYDVEDYHDNFEGIAAITFKMNEEIEKTLLPLAPRIVSMSTNVANGGWDIMKKSGVEVNQRVGFIGKIIIGITGFAIIISLGIGFLLSNMIIRQVSNVVVGLSEGVEKLTMASNQVSTSSMQVAEGA